MMMNMMVFFVLCHRLLDLRVLPFNLARSITPYAENRHQRRGSLRHLAFSPITLGAVGRQLNHRPAPGRPMGIIGLSGFFLQGVNLSMAGIFAFFLFQMVFMDTAATIPTGSGAERMKFAGFVIMGFWVSMLIYPVVGNWVWGGGWLANLGRTLGLGNGAVDFAGSGVVHMTGGAVGLAVAMVLGPRLGRF